MRLKALKSFVGQVTMSIDEVKEVTDERIANALINAGMAVKDEADKAKTKLVEKEAEVNEKGNKGNKGRKGNRKGKAEKDLNDVVENEETTKAVEHPPEEENDGEEVEEPIDEPLDEAEEVGETIEEEPTDDGEEVEEPIDEPEEEKSVEE